MNLLFHFLLIVKAILGVQVVYQGVVNDNSLATEVANAQLLNTLLYSLNSGDSLYIPKGNFNIMGGINVNITLVNITIIIDGVLSFSSNIKAWPLSPSGRVLECFSFDNLVNSTITSNGMGELYGNGRFWWAIPLIGYAVYAENRPRLILIRNGQNVIVQHLLLLESPYWTATFDNQNGLEVSDVHIVNRRTNNEGHGIVDLTAFNTDGIDVTGANIWIHDCTIWNQDDCIAIKDRSHNILVERINASGLGLVIGSIGSSNVNNVTFRDSYLYKTYKGIYTKFRDGTRGTISNVLFENIVMDEPQQFAIWIGPAQQSDSSNLCNPGPCSICFPQVPFAECLGSNSAYTNITLSNITINSPVKNGLILGGNLTPIRNITFHNVKVNTCVKANQDVNVVFPYFYRVYEAVTNDPQVIYFYLLFVAAGFFLVLIPCLLMWRYNCCKRFFQLPNLLMKLLAYSSLTLSAIVGLVAVIWILYNDYNSSSPREYFYCYNVLNAVATGDTYPVPYCFKDNTTSSVNLSCESIPAPVGMILFIFAIVGSIVLCCFFFAPCIPLKNRISEIFFRPKRDKKLTDSNFEMS